MTLQHITLAEVRAACIKAYDENRLAAQNIDHSDMSYYYKRGKNGCAIGVALTLETSNLIPQTTMTLKDSPNLKEAFTWNDDDFEELSRIQTAHDGWRNAEQFGSSEDKIKMERISFLKLIDHPNA